MFAKARTYEEWRRLVDGLRTSEQLKQGLFQLLEHIQLNDN